MKTLSTLVLSLYFTISYSQSFSVETTDTSFTGLAIQYDFGGHINLSNLTGSDLPLKWERIENDLPNGWETSICDPGACRPPEADSSNFTLPVTGNSNYINIHFYPNDVEGLGTTRVKVENPNDPTEFYILTFIGDTRPLSTTEISLSSVSVYPNPVNDKLNIDLSTDSQATISLYDMTGNLVSTVNGQSNLSMDTSFLSSGIYLLEVKTDNDSFTQKVIIQ